MTVTSQPRLPGGSYVHEEPAAPAEPLLRNGLLRHHDDEGFLDTLELLISSHRIRATDDLVRYAVQADETEAADFLRGLAAQGLPLDLAFDALRVHVRIVAFKRNNALLRACQDRRLGLVLPLPPHILDAFVALPKVMFLAPDGHPLPPKLRALESRARRGSRAGRNAAAEMEVLVFEACREDGQYYLDAGVSDIVDLRIIPASTQLIVHLRPHRDPEDVALTISSHNLNVL